MLARVTAQSPLPGPPADVKKSPEFKRLTEQYADRSWRLENLYYVTNEAGERVPFKRRSAQKLYSQQAWFLDLIPKARQLGLSTEIGIEQLDAVVFKKNLRAGIIDFKLEDAKKKLAKLKFSYENLPSFIRSAVRLTKDNEDELRFSNGSSIEVGVSHRGSSLQFLHVSEFGKTATENPTLAREIRTGAFNTVAPGQRIVVEATAHGTNGDFYDMVQRAERAKAEGRPLTKLDFKLHFFGWWLDPKYRLPANLVFIPIELREYFAELKSKYGIDLDGQQQAWYAKTFDALGLDDMRSEFPSCIDGDQLIATKAGLVPIKDAEIDGEYIVDKFYQGEKEVFEVITERGYQVNATADHKFLCADGEFRELQDIGVGDEIALQHEARFPSEYQRVSYNQPPFVHCEIKIDERFASFIGMYMGDGSFHDGTLSIACDAQDTDLVAYLKNLTRDVVGADPEVRQIGTNKGCSEIRISRKSLVEPFRRMGLIAPAGQQGGMKRVVHVPEYIKRSPKSVVRAFLSSLFEADGFAYRTGGGVGFFTKHREFMRDVQLLLLQFGITSRQRVQLKLGKNGKSHTGFSLRLGSLEGEAFRREIGFLSARKIARGAPPARTEKGKKISAGHAHPIPTSDKIKSIITLGVRSVFDITTSTHEFAAGGIRVHNCLSECFLKSAEGTFFKRELTKARLEKRIGQPVPFDESRRVHTCWDKGMNEKSDRNSIWFFQSDGVRFRFIDYYENAGEALHHYVRILQDKARDRGFIYGRHIGPHDLRHRQWGVENAKTLVDIAKELGVSFDIVPKTNDKEDSIEAGRRLINSSWFDSEHTARGVDALDNYRKEWNKKLGQWTSQPLHDWASNGADAYQQAALDHLNKTERQTGSSRGARAPGSQWSN